MDGSPTTKHNELPAGCTVALVAAVTLLAIGAAERLTDLIQNTHLAERFVREVFRLGSVDPLLADSDWTARGMGIYPDEAAVFSKLAATTHLDDLRCRSSLRGIVTCTLTTTRPDGSAPLTTDVLFDFYGGLVQSVDVPTARPPTRQ